MIVMVITFVSFFHKAADAVAGLFAKKKKKARKVDLETFDDKYELTGTVLGTGASSIVKECRAKSDGALFAAKIVDKACDHVIELREQIFREVDVLRRCADHPNILQLKDFYETNTEFIFVFEKIKGGDLFGQVESRGHLSEASAVIRDVANALSFVHGLGLAHRDLKPENVLCVFPDHVSPAKLCDFNLVSATLSDGSPTKMVAVGTPDYMAPEVAAAFLTRQEGVYDKKCDIWSLGVMMYVTKCRNNSR